MFYQKILICLYSFLILFSSIIKGQEILFERNINPFPVADLQQNEIKNPFLGGFNNPIHQWVDIDADGDFDLFISDNSKSLTLFENIGSPEIFEYKWITDKYQNLSVGSWFKFLDIDTDNDYDFVAENPSGITRIYINEGSAALPNYTIITDSLKDINGVYIRAEGFSIPDWSDIDCDGDADLFLGKQNGTISYYNNKGLLNGLPQFDLVTTTFQNLVIITGSATPLPKTNHHGNNSITFADINNDGDNDIFWGDLFATSIVFIENFGTCSTPQFLNSLINEQYPFINPVLTNGYNFARFADIDNDNDLDMLFSPLIGSQYNSNLVYYENHGNSSAPDFIYNSGQFINMLDIGNYSTPAFVDIDNDSDLDLFIANDVDIHSPQKANSRLHFFENIGTSISPEFILVSEDYLEFDKEFDTNYSPAFADLDADGDLDLYLGGWNGKIIEYTNTGTVTVPNFIREDEEYFDIDVGSNSAPAFADMDNDDDLDMLVGEFSGILNYFKNEGSSSNPDFVLQADNYFSIRADQYSTPNYKDLDKDGLIDLIVGSENAGTIYYRNEGTKENALFNQGPGKVISNQKRTSPVFVDLDNDLDYDLVAGVKGGGLVYYKNITVYTKSAFNENSIVIFPNPFKTETQIRFTICNNCEKPKQGTLKIYDVLGRVVRQWRLPEYTQKTEINFNWDGTNSRGAKVSSGIYFAHLSQNNEQLKAAKILVIR